MALSACYDCGREVSTRARTCVHCGRPWPTCKGGLLRGFAVAVVALLAMAAFFVGFKSVTGHCPLGTKEVRAEKEEIRILPSPDEKAPAPQNGRND